MWLGLTTTHRQTWLFSSTSTYHSTNLLTARGVAHLVASTEQVARPATNRFHPSHWRPLEACCRPWTWWCNDATALAGYATMMMMMTAGGGKCQLTTFLEWSVVVSGTSHTRRRRRDDDDGGDDDDNDGDGSGDDDGDGVGRGSMVR